MRRTVAIVAIGIFIGAGAFAIANLIFSSQSNTTPAPISSHLMVRMLSDARTVDPAAHPPEIAENSLQNLTELARLWQPFDHDPKKEELWDRFEQQFAPRLAVDKNVETTRDRQRRVMFGVGTNPWYFDLVEEALDDQIQMQQLEPLDPDRRQAIISALYDFDLYIDFSDAVPLRIRRSTFPDPTPAEHGLTESTLHSVIRRAAEHENARALIRELADAGGVPGDFFTLHSYLDKEESDQFIDLVHRLNILTGTWDHIDRGFQLACREQRWDDAADLFQDHAAIVQSHPTWPTIHTFLLRNTAISRLSHMGKQAALIEQFPAEHAAMFESLLADLDQPRWADLALATQGLLFEFRGNILTAINNAHHLDSPEPAEPWLSMTSVERQSAFDEIGEVLHSIASPSPPNTSKIDEINEKYELEDVRLFKTISATRSSCLTLTTETRLTRIALRLRSYIADHGDPPASLEVLASADGLLIPQDPYAPDGQFRYMQSAPELLAACIDAPYLLYSVGYDQLDNGGLPPRFDPSRADPCNLQLPRSVAFHEYDYPADFPFGWYERANAAN